MSLREIQNRLASSLFVSTRYHGVSITLHTSCGEDRHEAVLVDEVERTEVEGRPTIFERKIYIPAEKVGQLGTFRNTVQKVSIESEVWHVIDIVPQEGGMVTVNLRRHLQHDRHSNIFDLHDEQAGWNEAS